MSEPEFEELIDRHGGDIARWPPALQAAAEALLARSAQARASLAEMIAVEGLLGLTRNWAPAGGSAEAMAAQAMRGPQLRSTSPVLRAFGVGFDRNGAGLAIAAALVLVAGLAVGMHHQVDTAADGLDEAPSQLLASALASGRSGNGDVAGDAISDVD